MHKYLSDVFQYKGTVTIATVSAMHIIQAIMMLLFLSAVAATPTLSVLNCIHAVMAIDGADFIAVIMLTTASLALVGALFPIGRARLGLLIPQHLILGLMALGGWLAIFRGAYLDGTIIARPHIMVDQIALTALWIVHSDAVLRRSYDM